MVIIDYIKSNLIKVLVPTAIILALGTITTCQSTQVSKYKSKCDALESTVTGMRQQFKLTTIKLNDSIKLCQAEAEALSYTKKNLESEYGKLLKASKLKAKDVGSVTKVETTIHSVDTVIAQIDTFGGLTAKLEDRFVDIEVNIDTARQAVFDYAIRDSLTIISVQKKHSWLFGLIKWNEHKSVRVINHNPKATITEFETINVIE